MKIAFSAPLVAVASVATLLLVGLHQDPGFAASPSEGKPLPEFVLPRSAILVASSDPRSSWASPPS